MPADEPNFGLLSTGERIAVALVLDRYDLLQRAWGTKAEAVHRLGQQWTQAALRVQRQRGGRTECASARHPQNEADLRHRQQHEPTAAFVGVRIPPFNSNSATAVAGHPRSPACG